MTKLLEWITVATVILVPWLAVVTNKFETSFTRDYFATIVVFPLLLVMMFGVVSVAVIAYRVYTFNDAVEAAQELTKQIAQAKKELAGRGFKFETKAASSNSVS